MIVNHERSISSSEYLSSLLAISSDVSIFLSKDKVITEINHLVEKLYGWERRSVIGKKYDYLYTNTKVQLPFPLETYNALINKINMSHETCISLENKKMFISWTIKPVYLADSGATGFILIGKNITEEKLAEIQNKNMQNQLEQISSCVPGNFYWKNRQGEYLGCNQALLKTLGLQFMNDIVGKTDDDLWPEQAQMLREHDQKVMNGSETVFTEETVSLFGNTMYFTVIKMPLVDDEGNVIGILGNSLDITELKNTHAALEIAKEQAEAASHAKTEFIANMGHDIRTPLTGIIGLSRYLEEEINDPEAQHFAKQIHQSGEQLLGLLNGVLDMITADSTNEDTVVQESFDVRSMINGLLELERPAVEVRQLTIEAHVDAAVPQYVVGDKMKLHRILLNLTGNAIKFTNEGHIELNARLLEMKDDTAMIEFSVKDTGIGIAEELQDKVFDRFFKVSPSYKGLYTGNGIGLHIAQKYIDLLRGEIRLTSQLGVGTTFSFVLPMRIGEKPTEEESSVVQPIGRQETTELLTVAVPKVVPDINTNSDLLKVLLVEDNVAAMNVLKIMVKRHPVAVSAAMDAESAFALVQSQSFDLMITDLGLPQKQGDELATMVRAYEQEQQRAPMTIVGLTGHALGEITQTCLDAGMNAVYRKPIVADTLKQLIDKAIHAVKVKEVTKAPVLSTGGALGTDLPDTEEQLFQLDAYPLLDISVGIKCLESEDVVLGLLKGLKADSITDDLALIKIAHEQGDWDRVGDLAHKMKSGATFGTVRLYYALLYMERYRKAGHSGCLESLYQQMLRVIDETMTCLEELFNNTSAGSCLTPLNSFVRF